MRGSPAPATPAKTSPSSANAFIEDELDNRLQALERVFDCHALAFNGLLLFRVDDLIRDAVEDRKGRSDNSEKLVVLLTTGGGYIEVVQRIVHTFRRHYKLVDFIVPNHAYSAGTVLAMSGDAIHMDYYSRLGPIDPQVETDRGMVPALGYLEQYDKLIDKANNGQITTAEMHLLIAGFDQAELSKYEHARALSISLLEEWLVKYKFKNWKVTATRKKRVSKDDKERRAREIAEELSNTKKWHVHGHGISMELLENDLNLRIDDFEKHPEKSRKIRGYHDLLSDYMAKLGTNGVIHVTGSYQRFL